MIRASLYPFITNILLNIVRRSFHTWGLGQGGVYCWLRTRRKCGSTQSYLPSNTSLERTRERQSAKFMQSRSRRSTKPLGLVFKMPSLDIPDDFPLAALIAQELTQVCIGQHHVRLNFYKLADFSATPPKWAPGAAIDIEAGFEFRESSGQVQRAANDTLGSDAACLTSLLGQTVKSVERLERNELLLCFSSSSTLRLCTDPIGFESYHLHIEGESVDVTTCQTEP